MCLYIFLSFPLTEICQAFVSEEDLDGAVIAVEVIAQFISHDSPHNSSGRSLTEAQRSYHFLQLFYNPNATHSRLASAEVNSCAVKIQYTARPPQLRPRLSRAPQTLLLKKKKKMCRIYYQVLTNVTFALSKANCFSLKSHSATTMTGLVHKACWPSPLRSVSLQIRLGHLLVTSWKERVKKDLLTFKPDLDLKKTKQQKKTPLKKKKKVLL